MMQSRLTALEQLGPSQFNLAMAAEVPAEMSELEGEYPCRQEAEAWEGGDVLLGAGSASSDTGAGRAGSVMIEAGNSVSSTGGSMSVSAGSGQMEGGRLCWDGQQLALQGGTSSHGSKRRCGSVQQQQ